MIFTAQPRLIVSDPDEALAFYDLALGATVDQRETIDGTVVHAVLRIDRAMFTVAAEVKDWGLLSPTTIDGRELLSR